MLANAILYENFNIICPCETCLNESIFSSALFLQDYEVYRGDRPHEKLMEVL